MLALNGFLSNHFLRFFGIVNLLFAMMTLLPIPTLDSAIIWRELRGGKA